MPLLPSSRAAQVASAFRGQRVGRRDAGDDYVREFLHQIACSMCGTWDRADQRLVPKYRVAQRGAAPRGGHGKHEAVFGYPSHCPRNQIALPAGKLSVTAGPTPSRRCGRLLDRRRAGTRAVAHRFARATAGRSAGSTAGYSSARGRRLRRRLLGRRHWRRGHRRSTRRRRRRRRFTATGLVTGVTTAARGCQGDGGGAGE